MIQESFIDPMYDFRPTEAETKCKKPCKKMTNKITVISDTFLTGSRTYFKFRFKETVRVEKKVVVYTWFDFIVDVGSSLGLWLGLSALGITDLGIEAFLVVEKWLKGKFLIMSFLLKQNN